MTVKNYKIYFAIEKELHRQGFHFDRSEIIAQYTEGEKEGLRELTDDEYEGLIKWLSVQVPKQVPKYNPNDPLQKQRRKIIAMLCKVGMTKLNKADMPRIYKWVRKYGYLHKPLNDYTISEIPKLVTQTHKFYKSHIERL